MKMVLPTQIKGILNLCLQKNEKTFTKTKKLKERKKERNDVCHPLNTQMHVLGV